MSHKAPQELSAKAAFLDVQNLQVDFALPNKQTLRAVHDVSFQVAQGACVGLVGESGSGKSTLGRAILQLLRPTRGAVLYDGQNLAALWQRRWGRWQWSQALVAVRRDIQMIFQDPYASLNPRMSVEQIVAEPLLIHRLAKGAALAERIDALLLAVGLDKSAKRRMPHAFSGGQRQRIGIARALATRPKLIVADEPVSALDVSMQAQILNLLQDLQISFDLTIVFIAHDLSVVHHLCERVAVFYGGRIVEQGPTTTLFSRAQHPYTKALLAAVPTGAPIDTGTQPSALHNDSLAAQATEHCPYVARCPMQIGRCRLEAPVMRTVGPEHHAACHLLEATPPTGASF